jgi:hypothetical protein
MGTYIADFQRIFAMNIGIELPLLYATAALALAVTGFGQYSLDALLGIAGHLSAMDTWIALTVGIVGGFANVALRRRPVIAQNQMAGATSADRH